MLRHYDPICGPLILWGPPGCGKTAAVSSYAKRYGWHLEVIGVATRQPEDFLGMPYRSNDGMVFDPPAWAKRAAKAEKALIFFDELSCAKSSVQAAVLKVIDERLVGEFRLPPTVWMVAAANPPDQAAEGFEMKLPLANRFRHRFVKEDPEDFTRNFPSYWDDPPEIAGLSEETWAQVRAKVAGFIHSNPATLLIIPKDGTLAWPSPRTWDKASRVLAACNLNIKDAEEGITECVGVDAASAFIRWLTMAELPTPEECVADPAKINTKRGDIVFTCLSSIFQKAKTDKTFWNKSWNVLTHVAEHGWEDLAVRFASDMAKTGTQQGWMVSGASAKGVQTLLEKAKKLEEGLVK
ncbi:MAG: AAA family ATPase [Candidatus Methanomethylicaceae archaeon]